MVTLSRLCQVFAAAAALAACSTPDLVLDDLAVTPGASPAGGDLEIRSAVRNVGKKSSGAGASVDLYESPTDFLPDHELLEWELPPGETLRPGESVGDTRRVRIRPDFAPGDYYLCGDADPMDRVKEKNENNNRHCMPFKVLTGKPVSADLVIDKVIPGNYSEASRVVTVRIRNAGTAATQGPIRIMAFKRAPREPLLFIRCALTEGQLAAGSPSTCKDVEFDEKLQPGVTRDVTGYFAYVVSNGAEFIRQPIKGGYKRPEVSRTIDFMVDGCFPPADKSPVECRVYEIDEINNFRELTFKSR